MQFKINTRSLFNSQYNSISNQIVNMFFLSKSGIWIVWKIASLTQCKSKIHLSFSCVIFDFTLILHWVTLRPSLEVFLHRTKNANFSLFILMFSPYIQYLIMRHNKLSDRCHAILDCAFSVLPLQEFFKSIFCAEIDTPFFRFFQKLFSL